MTKHVRAKNLTDSAIAEIVRILDGWSTKLTWELLIGKIEQRLRVRYTRQALFQHDRISLAFATRKEALTKGVGSRPKTSSNPELEKTIERLELLKAENERLEAENNRLLEQFWRWAYNASTRGLSAEFLNQQPPAVDRQQTKISKKGRR